MEQDKDRLICRVRPCRWLGPDVQCQTVLTPLSACRTCKVRQYVWRLRGEAWERRLDSGLLGAVAAIGQTHASLSHATCTHYPCKKLITYLEKLRYLYHGYLQNCLHYTTRSPGTSAAPQTASLQVAVAHTGSLDTPTQRQPSLGDGR
jgi:hypothetical protein